MLMCDFVEKLDKEGKLVRIKKEVSTEWEIPSLMRKLDRKPLFFEKVKGSEYPVAANLWSTKELVALGLGMPVEKLIPSLANAVDNPREPEIVKREYSDIGSSIDKLPVMLHYKKDGGPYISSSVIIARDKEYGLNASYHRSMVIGDDRVVIRICPRHLESYIERGLKEFAICIGCPTQVQVTAAISCEIEKSELSIANALEETSLVELDGHLVPEAEFVIIAELTGERMDEGPFVDLTGTYDIVRKERVAKIKKIYAKSGAIYNALLPGGNEHRVMMGMPREPTIFREVNKVCRCVDVNLPPGGCSWLHGVVKIDKQNPDDGKKAIEATFKGHPSVKHVFVVDEDINIYNPVDIEWAFSTRFQADKDLVVKPGEKGSSLDPSSNLETRETTKVGFDLTIPLDKERKDFERAEPSMDVKPEEYV